jgi:8-oxo-dGTP pyrophosphatase MutT (NUDIX family)
MEQQTTSPGTGTPESGTPESGTPKNPVTPRPAATILIVREGAAGPEVLMGMRGAQHRFMPNRLVFPGGAVDPEDYEAAPATPLRPHVLRLLTRHADPKLAAALGIAAARELQEETDLSLGTPPALGPLDYLFRAVTPPASPVRFDARFFVADVSHVSGTIAGSGELEGLRYYGVEEALALELAYATRSALERLRGWLATDEDARAARQSIPVFQERVWTGG